jgi:hypothetical protein
MKNIENFMMWNKGLKLGIKLISLYDNNLHLTGFE